jgi:disulfide bond formation protein DsbB
MTAASRDRAPAALALLAAAMLAAAFAFEHLAGLRPCALCWWQRYAWMAALALALPAAALGTRRPAGIALLGLAALATLAGAGIAAYHVGVEQRWGTGTAECGATLGAAASVEERLRQLLATPVVRCDEVAWSFAGLSMAGWNGAVAAVGGGLALATLRRRMSGGERT